MATLWLFADASDQLAAHAPIEPNDVVRRIADDPGPLPASEALVVVAGSMRGLRHAADVVPAVGLVRRFEVLVGGPRASLLRVPSEALRATRPQDVELTTVDVPEPHARLRLRLSGAVPAGDLLAGALGMNPSRSRRTRRGASVGDNVDARTSTPTGLMAPGEHARWSWANVATLPRAEMEHIVSLGFSAATVGPLDIEALTPVGVYQRSSTVTSSAATAWLVRNPAGRGWDVVTDEGAVVTTISRWLGLSDTDVGRLRGLRAIRVPVGATAGPGETALLVAQASVAAVPMVPERLDPITAGLLGPSLTADLARYADLEADDDIAYESWLMDLRRSGFTTHSDHPVVSAREPWITVLLATMRPDLLPSILAQLDRQSWTSFDVVVGLHGGDADEPIVRSAVADFSRPVTVVEVNRDHNLGQVLEVLSGHARGDYIAKVDDDDWYGEYHLTDLMHAVAYSGATIVGSGAEFVYLAELDMTIRRQSHMGHAYSRGLAGGTLLIARGDLQGVGGWRPVPRAVDTALIDSVLAAGGSSYRSHGLGYVLYRAPNGHTWDNGPAYFLRKRPPQWTGFKPPPGIAGAPRRDDKAQARSWFDTRSHMRGRWRAGRAAAKVRRSPLADRTARRDASERELCRE